MRLCFPANSMVARSFKSFVFIQSSNSPFKQAKDVMECFRGVSSRPEQQDRGILLVVLSARTKERFKTFLTQNEYRTVSQSPKNFTFSTVPMLSGFFGRSACQNLAIKPSGHHPGQAYNSLRALEGGKERLCLWSLGRQNWPSTPQVEPGPPDLLRRSNRGWSGHGGPRGQ